MRDLSAALHAWFDDVDSALVAFSGGVDSAVVLAAAHRRLGVRTVACIGIGPSYPERERRDAEAVAASIGATVRAVATSEAEREDYLRNATDRCYWCKDDLYGRLRVIADSEGWGVVVDGTNADDLGDHRPGRVAAREAGVRSPLVELGVDKEQVRTIARSLGLTVWDKPAMACLSSRVPHGTRISPELLQRIERAEDVLAAIGLRQFRVRHHGDVARVEIEPDEFGLLLRHRDDIVRRFRGLGYRHVTLDLDGFRSGSTNGVPTLAIGEVEGAS